MTATTTHDILRPFADQWAVLLTTFRRDGTPVGTAVSLAVDGDRGYFRTWDTSGKYKRIRNDPRVEIAPSTALGKPTGPAVRGIARLLEGVEAEHAQHLLEQKHPWLHGRLVTLVHRLTGKRTVYFEVSAVQPSPGGHPARALARARSAMSPGAATD